MGDEGAGSRKPKKLDDDSDVPPDQRVRVAVRIRPHNRADHGDVSCCLSVEGERITADNGQKSASFTFDNVFHENTQKEVYEELGKQMLRDAFSGYNSTIFAYGQTGSGKTYSMLGKEDDPVHEGLLPRICKELFENTQELMAEDATLVVKIQVSFVEVYNEKVRDLLQFEGTGHHASNEDLKELKLKEDKKSKTFIVDGLSLHTVMNYGRVKSLIEAGTALRTKAETGMNELSSRSHSVFCIYLHQTHEPPNPAHKDMESRITIVDLAGSERQSKTEIVSAVQAAEAEKINMSLLILGRCLSACSSGSKSHIPIRESVLTKMLMDIFGGNSKTTMFATLSPSLFNFAETMSTLQYAHNAKKIKHKAKQNTLAKAIEVKELKEQVAALGRTLIEELEKAAQQKDLLAKEIAAVNREKDLVSTALAAMQEENQSLRKQVEDLYDEIKRLEDQQQEQQHQQQNQQQQQQTQPAAMVRPTMVSKSTETIMDDGRVDGVFGTVMSSSAAGQLPVLNLSFKEEHESEEDEADRNRKLKMVQAELVSKLSPRGVKNPTIQPRRPTMSKPLASGKELRSYVGHEAAVYACSFSPSGEKMASASRDKTIKIWNVATGAEIMSLKGHAGFVLCCCFSPNGKDILSASDDKTVKVWDGEAGKKIVTLKGHNDKVYCCTFSPSGVEAASCSSDKTIKVWNVDSAKKLVTLRSHQSAVFGVGFSHDGKKLVSASDDTTVRIWDWLNGAELQCFQGHAGTVWSCVFSPNDEQILSASMDGTLKLWDIEMRSCVRTYRGHAAPVHHAIYAKDGANIISSSRDRCLKVWDTESGKVVTTLVGHTNTVYRCDVHNDIVISCSSDTTLKSWSIRIH